MRAAWETKKLADVAELQGRIGWKGLTAKEYTSDGPYFLSVHSLNYGDHVDFRDAFHISQERYDESPEIMLRCDDVLICKDGAGIGKVGIVGAMPGPSTINSSLLLIRAKPNIVPKYLYHVLQSPYFQAIVHSRLEGATTPHLYQRDIATFPVQLPPLEEQLRIVAVLDEAFAAIATATANAEKNLANARKLFACTIEDILEGASGCQAMTLLAAADQSCSLSYGIVQPGDEQAGGLPIVRPTDLQQKYIELGPLKRIALELASGYQRTKLRGDELLLCVRGTTGTLSTAAPELAGGNVTRGIVPIRFNPAILSQKLGYYLLLSASLQKQIKAATYGTALMQINIRDLKQLKLRVPKLAG